MTPSIHFLVESVVRRWIPYLTPIPSNRRISGSPVPILQKGSGLRENSVDTMATFYKWSVGSTK